MVRSKSAMQYSGKVVITTVVQFRGSPQSCIALLSIKSATDVAEGSMGVTSSSQVHPQPTKGFQNKTAKHLIANYMQILKKAINFFI